MPIRQIPITATSEAELNMRIDELVKRGWEVKAIGKPELKEGGMSSYRDNNRHTVRFSGQSVMKHRAMMVKVFAGE